ncbi:MULTISPECIES: MobF family relaxase [unclassified Nocardia]|uniref:MobF family relaxase n=1 Tax=unclassified Nocardia TaxID=2637762 RepID=UPI001CE4379A|nr:MULTISPECIES: MobF family relaxase [unclassified Nocardia]
MTATVHKLSAGDGFNYYLRQTAAHDASERGRSTLADYYSAKGESPGVWMGSGLSAFDTIRAGDEVAEAQMRALFGLGRHPDAEAIEDRVFAEQLVAGAKRKDASRAALAASQLGQPFRIYHHASEFRRRCAEEFTAYNLDQGSHWNAAISDDVRSEIRTRVAREMFVADLGREPLNDAELSGWVARNSRNATTAISGFDVCFSPVKSVSVLWALTPRPIAELVEQAHRAAVTDALAFLESHAAYTRLGANGVAQVDTCGLIATAFEHRESRAGDPDLHTHVVISNKVRTREGELWRALDARMLYRLIVASSEVYNTSLELHVHDLVGGVFVDRGGGDPDRRPVRELVGVDPDLSRLWSRRDAEIEVKLGELAREFQRRWGREPTTVEMLKLAQCASRETRPPKHEPRSRAEQRAVWWAEATEQLGGQSAVEAMVWSMCHSPVVARPEVTPEWIAAVADRVIDAVSLRRSVWQRNHIHAEVQRQLRGQITRAERAAVVAAVTEAVVSVPRSISRTRPDMFDEPRLLQRADGTSAFTVAESEQFTSAAVLLAEQRLVAAARRAGGRTVTDAAVDVALLEYAANNDGRELTAGQAALVREFATSGRTLQVAVAPAGTGKTVAMHVLVRAWLSEGGTVLGLAPTAASAAQLQKEIDTAIPVETIDKLTYLLTHLTPDSAARYRVPHWVSGIGPGTLVIIDEAAKASARQLDLVVDFVARRGAIVRAIGDDRQLASIAAGGVMRDIIDAGGATTLTQVMRFIGDPAEAAATLAIRAGDPAAIAFYTDRRRVHIGALETVIDAAYTAWKADRAAGLDSVMLAQTREIVAILNHRARTDRLTTAGVPDVEVGLSDGLQASTGDLICTRRNNPRLRFSSSDYVRNGYRWLVTAVHTDGSVTAAHVGSGRLVRLPADYLAAEVTLGYASTIDSAQGITADTGHSVFTGSENRAQFYVAISRGRRRNDIYAQTAVDLEHAQFSDRAVHPPTIVDLLTDVLARDGGHDSATTAHRETFDPATRLGHAADAYSYAVGAAAEHLAGPEILARIDSAAEDLMPGLTQAGAWPVLRAHLAIITISTDRDGQPRDPVTALAEAIAERDFDGVIDPAAVLDWRLDQSGRHSSGAGPLPWLTGIPPVLEQHPVFGAYLTARSQLVITLTNTVVQETHAWTTATAPIWACPLLAATRGDSALIADLTVWRVVRRIEDNDRRATGPELPKFGIARAYQDDLIERITAQLGNVGDALGKWVEAADEIDLRIAADPYWPVLAERLDLAHRAGIDVAALLHTAAENGPLPDEQPAAALWWRLAEQLDPGVLDDAAAHDPLRPGWITDVEDILTTPVAALVTSDPAWPQLVAAVEAANPARWTPHDILATAFHLITDNSDTDQLPRPDQWATALAWRITAITRHHQFLYGAAATYAPTQAPPHPADDEELAARAGHPPDPHTDPQLDSETATAFFGYPDPRAATLPDDNDPNYHSSLASFATSAEQPTFDTADDTDEWDNGLDEWCPPVDPASIPEHLDLPSAERAQVLRAEYLEYARTYRELATAYANGAGRHLRALDGYFENLRARRDAQRPFLLAARDAHDAWIEADREAAEYKAHVEGLTRNMKRQSDPDIDDLEKLLPDIAAPTVRDQFAAQLTELRTSSGTPAQILELHVARICAESATTAAELAKTEADQTRQALLDAAGPQGVVTSEDVELARLTADSIDLAELNQARFRLAWKEGQLLRNGIEPADLRAPSEAADAPTADPKPHPSLVAPPSPKPDISTLTNPELQDHIRHLQVHLATADATDAVLFRWTRPDPATLDGELLKQRIAAERMRHQQLLATAQAEQQRRQQLPPEQLTAEEEQRIQRSKRHTSRQQAPVRSPTMDHAPDTAEGAGLE